MKEWECVQVDHHRNIGRTIEEYQKKGWCLHTYWPVHVGSGTNVNHYLLLEREATS